MFSSQWELKTPTCSNLTCGQTVQILCETDVWDHTLSSCCQCVFNVTSGGAAVFSLCSLLTYLLDKHLHMNNKLQSVFRDTGYISTDRMCVDDLFINWIWTCWYSDCDFIHYWITQTTTSWFVCLPCCLCHFLTWKLISQNLMAVSKIHFT